MRPFKDFFIEEYWDIAYRKTSNTLLEEKAFTNFNRLRANKRYWYADPMLIEKDGKIYLFVEVFDNKTGLGCIGYSILQNDVFTTPKIIIRESFHMSYPYVFEINGQIYMMPETSGDRCIQLYKAVEFPEKWEKFRVISNINNAVDSVLLDDKYIVTSLLINNFNKSTKLAVIDYNTGRILNDNFEESQQTRGAGKVFSENGRLIRPAQDCSGGVYGKGLVFYEIIDSGISYCEKEYTRFLSSDILDRDVIGIHTYSTLNGYEVIDCKRKRLNPYIIYYSLLRKLK